VVVAYNIPVNRRKTTESRPLGRLYVYDLNLNKALRKRHYSSSTI
jgi:hypothetical protein